MYEPLMAGKKQICRDRGIPFYLYYEEGYEKVLTEDDLREFYERKVDEAQKKAGTDFDSWMYDCKKAGLLIPGK